MNPLEQLKDIHLADQVSDWPPAYGWWLLVGILLLLAILALVVVIRKRRHAQARRQALSALNLIDRQSPDWPQQINQLYKRFSLSYFPQKQVARLHSADWLVFLSEQIPASKRQTFLQNMQPFQARLYQHDAGSLDFATVHQQTEIWLKSATLPKQIGQLAEEAEGV